MHRILILFILISFNNHAQIENDIKEVNPLMKSFAAIKYLIFGTSLDEKQ